jgi:hypothetical protein
LEFLVQNGHSWDFLYMLISTENQSLVLNPCTKKTNGSG